MALRIILFLILKFFLGGESGASFSWSAKWQDKKPWFSEVPEALDALILAYIATSMVWANVINLQDVLTVGLHPYYVGVSSGILVYIASAVVAYAGIQSATWTFLQWEQHEPNRDRSSTTKPLVDKVAGLFEWTIGQEGYSWVSASVKGSIICFPAALLFAPIGGVMFASGYEIGSWFKRKGRDKYLPKWLKAHAISEGMSFVMVALFYLGVAYLASVLG